MVAATCHRIDTDPELTKRAATIRSAAGEAETLMEQFYARRIIERLARSDPDARRRSTVDYLIDLLRPFPYVENYQSLVDAELRAISGWRSLTFCGAGALPLTGLLAHVMTGASVRLVEVDPVTADLATHLIYELARFGAVRSDAIEVIADDAAEIDLDQSEVVVVASLLPEPVVTQVASHLGMSLTNRCLLVRSATGLASRLAYDRVETATLADSIGRRRLGVVAPLGSIWPTDEEPHPSVGVLASDVVSPAPQSVLNCTDLY